MQVITIEHIGIIKTERGTANVLRVNGERCLCFPGAADPHLEDDIMHITALWPESLGNDAPFPPSLDEGPELPAFLLGYEEPGERVYVREDESKAWRLQSEHYSHHASREEQHARYLDCGPQAWDDR